MAEDETRLYEVSDPRKSFAGHTVYRVSAKVCQEGIPSVVEEVIVWRRFSEFKKLRKDLLKLYNTKLEEYKFPSLPKATFFDRFDEAVIEERRRDSHNLLSFAGSHPQLAKSQCFRKFFEGGIYQRTACSRNSSRTSSFSSTCSDGDVSESHSINKDDKCTTTQDSEESRGYLELGGVWLCKQPSLVEGLDKTETTADETIYEQSSDVVDSQLSTEIPSFIRRRLSDEDSEEDAFGNKEGENNEQMSWDSDGEDDQKSRKTSTWLQRAISLCSEGDDIETLACEAENDEIVKELNFPKPFAELEEGETKSQKENELSKYEGNVRNDAESDCVGNSDINVQQMANTKRNIGIESKRETVAQVPKQIQGEYRENQRTKDESCEAHNSPKSISKQENPGDSSALSKESQKGTKPCRFDPQDTSFLSDSTGDDYLFAAAKVVRQALNFELDGQYKEAFHLYKKCVSLLLSGVQGEKDAKRRDAVRRKTAQYLLKAEALYTAYVHESKELPESTSGRLNAIEEDSNHYQEVPSQLQLADYSVIGIIGKVMLVKYRAEDKNTYVIKVLPKIESCHHSRHKSRSAKRRKSLLESAYAQCPFIVKLHQHCETPTSVLLLVEHARGGLLFDYLLPFKRRQQQQSSVTSKSQCYVHNLKETEMKKKIIHPCHSRNERDNQKTEFLVIGSRQEKEGTNSTADHDTERSTICQKKEEGKMKNYGENISGSARKTSTFALLDEYFSSPSQKSIESCVRTWMAEIILALAHLHSNGIICRDLNSRNILISDEGHVLLTHFSVWEDVNEEADLFSLEEEYCAPELFRLEEVTSAADWWSVGALFYEILTGQALSRSYPWGIRSHTEIETASNLSAEASALIRELLVVSPSERLGSGVNGLEDIKSHPFFAGVDWSALKSNKCQS